MRVVLASEFFCRNMGYLENVLPKYLARLGVETHVIATDLSPSYRHAGTSRAYANAEEQLPAGTKESRDGYTLHILGHKIVGGHMRMIGLPKTLSEIRPDVVQTMAAIGWIPLDVAVHKLVTGFQMFTGCHTSSSTFMLARRAAPWWNTERLVCAVTRALPGRLISFCTEKCYAATEDCALVASRYFGVERSKVETMYLGVDTEYFHTVDSADLADRRIQLRRRFGFADSDVVCIYTGKLTPEKDVLTLADAVEQLRSEGQRFRGLFIGDGPEADALRRYPSSVVTQFVQFSELASYYQSSDIGVWPGTESISMLDAAACGLPIVISNGIFYRAPIEGNGKVFLKNSVEDLKRVLYELRDPQVRHDLGLNGSSRLAHDFSWENRARQRLQDYEAAVRSKGFRTAKRVPYSSALPRVSGPDE